VLYIIVFCNPPSNIKVRIGRVVVKEVAYGRGKVDLYSTAARSDEVGIFQD
jgi:hypothetical protein